MSTMSLAVSCSIPVPQNALRHSIRKVTAGTPSSGLVYHPIVRLYGPSARHPVVARGLGGSGDDQRKGIKREDEPEEYWMSASERDGKNPFKDPLAIIGIAAIFLPFILLGIAIALGLVDVNGGR